MSSLKYFNGPNSEVISELDSISNILTSIFDIESVACSNFMETSSLFTKASSSCFSNTFLFDDDVVVIITPVSLSLYCILLFANPSLKLPILLSKVFFSPK